MKIVKIPTCLDLPSTFSLSMVVYAKAYRAKRHRKLDSSRSDRIDSASKTRLPSVARQASWPTRLDSRAESRLVWLSA